MMITVSNRLVIDACDTAGYLNMMKKDNKYNQMIIMVAIVMTVRNDNADSK